MNQSFKFVLATGSSLASYEPYGMYEEQNSNHSRLLTCTHCSASYLINLDEVKNLTRLVCNGCGGNLTISKETI